MESENDMPKTTIARTEKMRRTQKQLFYEAQKKIAEANRHVMEMIKDPYNPLTKKDLHLLADRFPERWNKYRTLLD